MIASLMMYARPELAAAHMRFWDRIRDNLRDARIAAPDVLSQAAPEFDVWLHPKLALSQTCGMPYRLWLHDRVTYVATPDYGLDGCPAGYYRSPIVVRADDDRCDLAQFRTATFTYNATHSQSGYASICDHMKPLGLWFDHHTCSGAHLASARAVANGDADIAALDAVSWDLMQSYEGFTDRLRVLDWTAPTPGLPLITSITNNPQLVRNAVETALNALSEPDRLHLRIKGLVDIPKERYLAVPTPDGVDYSRPT